MKRTLAAAACLISLVARADRIELDNGRTMQGVVESQSDSYVVIRTRGGTVTLPRASVLKIEKTVTGDGASLPKWDVFMTPTAKATWAEDLRQIPATVIDVGVLKNVPYLSYKAGDYELNIYGDPDHPACVEIGVRNDLIQSKIAKANCKKFVADVLQNGKLVELLNSLNMEKDSKEVEGITIEVTPPTDPDAYGGWWISAYSIPKLDASRATEAELAKITQKRALAAAPAASVEPAVPPVAVTAANAGSGSSGWTADDMKYSRAPRGSAPTSGGGSVYVRGYTRANGTYVSGHTRAAPGHGGGRR